MTFADWLFNSGAWAIILGTTAAILVTALLIRRRMNPFWSCLIGPFALGCVVTAICLGDAIAAGHVRDAGDLRYVGVPVVLVLVWGLPGTVLGAAILALIGRRRDGRTKG